MDFSATLIDGLMEEERKKSSDSKLFGPMFRDSEGKCGLVWSCVVFMGGGQSRAGQGRAGQGRIGQERTGKGFTSLDPRDAILMQRRSSA